MTKDVVVRFEALLNLKLQCKLTFRYKYVCIYLIIDGYCTCEIKMRIAIGKEAFNRNISLLTSKVNIELKKKLVR